MDESAQRMASHHGRISKSADTAGQPALEHPGRHQPLLGNQHEGKLGCEHQGLILDSMAGGEENNASGNYSGGPTASKAIGRFIESSNTNNNQLLNANIVERTAVERRTSQPENCNFVDICSFPTNQRHPSAALRKRQTGWRLLDDNTDKRKSDRSHWTLYHLPSSALTNSESHVGTAKNERQQVPFLRGEFDHRTTHIGREHPRVIEVSQHHPEPASNSTRGSSADGAFGNPTRNNTYLHETCNREHAEQIHATWPIQQTPSPHSSRHCESNGRFNSQCNLGTEETLRFEHITNQFPSGEAKGELTQATRVFPLYTQQMGRINLERLTAMMNTSEFKIFQTAYQQYSASHSLERNTKFNRSELFDEDIHQLLNARYIEETEEELVEGTIIVKSVDEPAKERRRFIAWPKEQNGEKEAGLQMPTSAEYIISAHEKLLGVCIDMKNFYNQFQMHPEARPHYCFKHGPKWYRLTVIPTGGRTCSTIAEITMRTIARIVSEEHGAVNIATYIDNVRFLANSSTTIMNCTSLFYKLCTDVEITVNEKVEALEPSSAFTFLGVQYDLEKQTVCVREKTLQKLATSASEYGEASTLRDCLGVFGRLVWSSLILNIRFADFYYVFKFLRRRVGLLLNDTAQMWPSAKPQWDNWITRVLHNKPRPITITNDKAPTLYTDASLTGYGAIAFHQDHVSIVASTWTSHTLEHASINLLELKAVQFALEWMQLRQCHVIIDNTTAISWIKKGRARNFLANRSLQKILRHDILSLNYINSESNPADYWSRIFSCN